MHWHDFDLGASWLWNLFDDTRRTLPDTATEQAMIRICQKVGSNGCTNADTVSHPSTAPYTLVSRRFSVTSAPVTLEKGVKESRRPFRQTGAGTYEWNLELATAGELSVIAYDADGREMEVLFTQRVNAGNQRISFGSKGLSKHPEWIVRARFNGRDL